MRMTNILRRTRPIDKLHILCFNTHERYETHLCSTGHRFFAMNLPNMKKWKTDFAAIPYNYIQLNEELGANQLPVGLEIDLVLSHQKFGQFQLATKMANRLGVPIISMEHTLPIREWPVGQFNSLRSMRGEKNVFLSEFSRQAWQWEGDYTIIPAAVDSTFFRPLENNDARDGMDEPYALSIVNDWKERDYFCGYKIWEEVVLKHNIPHRVRGINKDWTTPTKDVNELRKEYDRAALFLNTSVWSSCPYTLLEAMACGCPVVSTATTMIPSIIEHGKNGFISNDPNQLVEYVKTLLADVDMREQMGKEARKTVVEKFSLSSFVDNWNTLFQEVIK